MKQFHHLRFHADSPGVCFVNRAADDEEVAFNILTTTAHTVPRDRPVALPWQTQQFCREDTQSTVCDRSVEAAAVSTAGVKPSQSDSDRDSSVESV